MKTSKSLAILYLLLFLASLHISFSVISEEAARENSSMITHHNLKQYPISSTSSNTFNVLHYGAEGDGLTDDSQALLDAWEAACKVEGERATVVIPEGSNLLIKKLITLKGRQPHCMPQLVLQIDGTILAPPRLSSWQQLKHGGLLQWIDIKWVQNFTIEGNGIIDGQGSEWWAISSDSKKGSQYAHVPRFKRTNGSQSTHVPHFKPTALRFFESDNITVRHITIRNSPQCHLKFDNSTRITVQNVTISAPGSSPNTDGIHLQNSTDVEIHQSNISCGDDCISIQTGCSNVHVHDISCGPGHGISLGGLGSNGSLACVSDIVVENIQVNNAEHAARIKTWRGSRGSVKNVTFSNIEVSNVSTPLVIDQFYCEKERECKNQRGGSSMAISNINFSDIWGTYSRQPVNVTCSKDVPCVDVNLFDIQLNPMEGIIDNQFKQASCSNSYGETEDSFEPQDDIIDNCLRGKKATNEVLDKVHHEDMLCQQRGH